MVKRRKARSGRKRFHRRFFRRRFTLRRRVAALSRRIAAEVKKADNNQLVTQGSFVSLSPQSVTSGSSSLADYGLLYQIFGNNGTTQGYQLDDFIGEQIRAKYLYIGLHLQQVNQSVLTVQNGVSSGMMPITLRIMLIQDRNYNNVNTGTANDFGTNVQSVGSMVYNLFGIDRDNTANEAYQYLNNADFTLLPINPQEPGRFNIIRDFRMSTAPGWRTDYYKKLMVLQRDLNSKGRIYFANTPGQDAGSARPPGDQNSSRQVSRNNLYLLFLWQYPYYGSVQSGALPLPEFNLSIQTRFAYYDN